MYWQDREALIGINLAVVCVCVCVCSHADMAKHKAAVNEVCNSCTL